MRRLLVLSFVMTAGLVVAWSQTAAPTPSGTDPDAANFTGKVTGYTTSDFRTNRYEFVAGARTDWHVHEHGQTLTVETGRMLTQVEGEPVREVAAGSAVFAPAGKRHWHGATATAPMRQVSLSFGITTWLEPVSDSQYRARP